MTTSLSAPMVRVRSRRKSRVQKKTAVAPLRGLLPVALALVVWQLTVKDSVFFPPPSQWIEALGELYRQGLLVGPLLVTLKTFAVSLLVATLLGTALGMLIGVNRHVDRGLTPLLDFFRSLPPPAIVPLATLLLGITLEASVAIVVLAVVWPIMLNVVTATRALPQTRTDMALVIGLTTAERLTKVFIPSIVPGVLVGVRVAVSVSLVVTLLVDILGSAEGAGRLLVQRQQLFDSPAVWGLLLVIGVFGYLLNVLLSLIEDRLLRNWPTP